MVEELKGDIIIQPLSVVNMYTVLGNYLAVPILDARSERDIAVTAGC